MPSLSFVAHRLSMSAMVRIPMDRHALKNRSLQTIKVGLFNLTDNTAQRIMLGLAAGA